MPRVPGTHVDDPKRVGRRLREARERAGLSQRDLAFPGCTNAYISRIESGNRIPSLQVIHEVARRLGELDEARARYEARLAEDERDPAALGGLGQIAFREGDLTRAIGLL